MPIRTSPQSRITPRPFRPEQRSSGLVAFLRRLQKSSRRGRLFSGLLAILLMLSACATPPAGPAFEPAARPPENRARIYLYRFDTRPSFSTVRVTIDGREIGTFRNNEYETLELAAGSHHLRAAMRSVALVAWGSNEQRLRLRPGETIFVKLSVRLTERAQPGGRELEIAGRASGTVSENVYLQIRPEREALSQLETTTRLVP